MVNNDRIVYNNNERVMEMKKIPIGTKSFSRLVEGNYYFVDKTLMIKEFLDRGTDVTLITRPRRFGKTINMSMMAEFFDITKDSKKIFNGTKIMETPYAAEINQYPTIFISFADAKRDKETVVSTIRTQIQNQWDKYDFVFENLKGFKKTNYERLYEVLADNNKNNLKGIDDAISFLMERMEDYYGKEVMVFIDEYDTPFVEAHTGGFYDEVRGGLAGLLHNSLKTSTSLKYAMLTGIQRVAKENIFSDLNNLDVYTVIDNDYSEYFGFSIEETKELLLAYFADERQTHIRKTFDIVKDTNEQIAYLRSSVIGLLIKECTQVFLNNETEILSGTFEGALIKHISERPGKAYKHCSEVSFSKIYRSRDVLDIELAGFRVINTLLELMIDAVTSPKKAYSQLLINRVSGQYNIKAPALYERVQAVLDYISGMTDVFALDLYRKINGNSLPAV